MSPKLLLVYALTLGWYANSVSLLQNTSKLTIHLIEKVEKSPGIAAYITDLLYRNDINIVNLFLGYEEIIIILDESDGPRTYSILKDATGNQGLLN